MFYGEVFKALNKAKVKYVVAGGTAVVLHGYERHTHDLDLMIFLEKKNLDKAFDAFKSIGYMPKVPVTKEQFTDEKQRSRWKKEKGMIVFSFVQRKPPFHLVDMFVDEPIPFETIYKNRVEAKVKGMTIPIISLDHLLKLKKWAGRDVDLIDITQLEAIKEIKKENEK